jgi:hypothetical protein
MWGHYYQFELQRWPMQLYSSCTLHHPNIFIKWTKLVIAIISIGKTIYSCYIRNKVRTCGLSISYLVLSHHLQSPLGMILEKMLDCKNICSRGKKYIIQIDWWWILALHSVNIAKEEQWTHIKKVSFHYML